MSKRAALKLTNVRRQGKVNLMILKIIILYAAREVGKRSCLRQVEDPKKMIRISQNLQ